MPWRAQRRDGVACRSAAIATFAGFMIARATTSATELALSPFSTVVKSNLWR
ncbi:hypothetical protein GGTG_10328 [Gaeumannomyces tritici R3-111a-1]|uniref:Uncharacterized protein n=1 Tax=Gaeumannomyces tritici (strain R3-111a-1) TaxID=644352 RepID=J3PA04_GAET3|nr:hypothetical protein GGTG_10328 [Gaeumannomyces tritici R3-111a-1]EJT73490.1 hypothetical protein GGTG_10328 [Gaeumannomyces tritici R3-111a-1]